MSGWHPDSESVVLDGERAHFVRVRPDPGTRGEAGDAPPLVLLHGFLVSSWAWRHNLEALGRRFDVIAPCQLGFGWSSRPRTGQLRADVLGRFLLRLFDRLGLERVHLCGNSLGGTVALWLAQHAPERVGRIVLVNPLAIADTLPRVPGWAHRPSLAPLYRLAVRPVVARLGLQLLAYRNLLVDESYLAGFRAPLGRRRSVRTALHVAERLRDGAALVEAGLGRVRQPVLIVWGPRDRLLSPRTPWRLLDRLPNARLVTFPACGHCPHEEAPEAFNRIVADFLAPG